MAKKFKFTLETLLHLRELEEKQEMAKLAELEGEREAIQRQYVRLNGNLEQAERTQRSGVISFVEQRRISQLRDLVVNEEKRIAPKLADVEQRIEQQRQSLLDKTRAKKVVERLKEKRFEEYKEELKKEEQWINDDNNQNVQAWRARRNQEESKWM
jgi:flagellar FliJ protein